MCAFFGTRRVCDRSVLFVWLAVVKGMISDVLLQETRNSLQVTVAPRNEGFETPIGPWSETVSNCRGPQDAGAARFLARDSASVDATDVVHWDKEKDFRV